MIKSIILVCSLLWLVACSAHDEQYYRMHPQALQQAINKCPERSPKQVSCEQLQNIALRLNELVYQLRTDPQGYGKRILALQEMVAKQENILAQNANQSDLKFKVHKNKQELKARLAVVKWLESPK